MIRVANLSTPVYTQFSSFWLFAKNCAQHRWRTHMESVCYWSSFSNSYGFICQFFGFQPKNVSSSMFLTINILYCIHVTQLYEFKLQNRSCSCTRWSAWNRCDLHACLLLLKSAYVTFYYDYSFYDYELNCINLI